MSSDEGWPDASTRLLGLLGWPVRHSLSPRIHNAALREHGLDLVYLALPVESPRLGAVVTALGAIGAVGANVTVPHKRAVVALCDRLTDRARLTGAVNTLSWTADGLVGDNTDAIGLEQVLRRDLGLVPGTATVVLGTGGAARACAVALARCGASATFVGRQSAAADELAGLTAKAGGPPASGVALAREEEVRRVVEEAALVINATPLGMAGESLPDPFQQLRPGQVALDLVYRPAETPFLVAAREAGAETHHGVGLLVAQAAESYRRWTGREAPLATMSAVALATLTSGAD